MSDPLIRVSGVTRRYPAGTKWFRKRHLEAVRNVDLEIMPGEVVALVGESGSGKSTLGRMTLGLVEPSEGQITFESVSWQARGRRARRELHRHSAMVFQNPYQSLNPRMRIGDALAEALQVAEVVDKSEVPDEVCRLLDQVHLPTNYRAKYPHALSGGERQRVAIARALACRPRYLVADEPTSALDVSISAEILNLLMDLKDAQNFACLFITHDLALALVLADRVMIMRDGEIVERGTPEQVTTNPSNPYTAQLLSTLPKADTGALSEESV
jgi:peptide/nickel transport system ATP-binding protein